MQPKVGVGVFIIKNNKILLGKRKNAHGDGTWSPPGGHLEFFETIEDCAKREVFEESGLKINNIKILTITNDMFKKENKHYITIFTKATNANGTPKILEPNKCEKWEWFDWDNLPEPLFLPLKNLIKTNYDPLNENNN